MEIIDDWNKMQKHIAKKEAEGNKILTLLDHPSADMIIEKIHELSNISELWICGKGFDRHKIIVKCVKVESKDIGNLEYDWENIYAQSEVRLPPSPLQMSQRPSMREFSRDVVVIYKE